MAKKSLLLLPAIEAPRCRYCFHHALFAMFTG